MFTQLSKNASDDPRQLKLIQDVKDAMNLKLGSEIDADSCWIVGTALDKLKESMRTSVDVPLEKPAIAEFEKSKKRALQKLRSLEIIEEVQSTINTIINNRPLDKSEFNVENDGPSLVTFAPIEGEDEDSKEELKAPYEKSPLDVRHDKLPEIVKVQPSDFSDHILKKNDSIEREVAQLLKEEQPGPVKEDEATHRPDSKI